MPTGKIIFKAKESKLPPKKLKELMKESIKKLAYLKYANKPKFVERLTTSNFLFFAFELALKIKSPTTKSTTELKIIKNKKRQSHQA